LSIDIDIDVGRSVHLRPLLPKAGAVLAEILGLVSIPQLTLEALENGQRETVSSDELSDETSPLFLISIAGEPETVALCKPSTRVSVMMASMRSNLEYALGAAVAITLAREREAEVIGDDWRFFSDELLISPEDLLRRLKVVGTANDYQQAAEQLSGKLGKEGRGDSSA
jgi:hypothetical protein